MKNRLSILIILTLFICCNSSKNIIKNRSFCKFEYSISKDEFTINTKIIDSLIRQKRPIIIYTRDSIKNEIWNLSKGNYFINQNINNIIITKVLNYSKVGNLESSEYIYSFGDIKVGNENYYNHQTQISNTINHEKGYKICWAEAIEIVKEKFQNKLSKFDSINYVLQRVDLNEFPNEKPMWSVGISPEPDDKIGETTYYKIDGVTGKYLGKFTARMVPN